MKILVVDDESNKLKAIMRVVREIDGIELDSVDITLQLNEAKEKLLNHRYDLMILDLNMPEVLGSDPDKEAERIAVLVDLVKLVWNDDMFK